MEIAGCCFPEDLLYDAEGFVWVKIHGNSFTVGLTQLQAFIVGRVNSIVAKHQGIELPMGGSVAFIETRKYAGNARTPLSGVVEEVNSEVATDPSLINIDPYGRGWIARLRPSNLRTEMSGLSDSAAIAPVATKVIEGRGLKCFSTYPEYHVSGIGGECPETLKVLGDLLESANPDDAVLLVTDNPAAEKDVPNWVSARGYTVLETRMEQPLRYHIIGKSDRR